MSSHLDSQLGSHLDSQILSLTEYSNKYHVSVSTLRRNIRAGKLPFSLKQGKYFLKDQSLVSLKHLKSFSPHKEVLSTSFVKNVNRSGLNVSNSQKTVSTNVEQQQSEIPSHANTDATEKKEILSTFKNKKIKQEKTLEHSKTVAGMSESDSREKSFSVSPTEDSFLDKIMSYQKEFLRQIELKETKIFEQQNQIVELNTLVALLEKENKELKSLLYQEKDMEEWLELK